NAMAANEKGWRDGDFNKKYGVTLASTFKLSNNTQVRLELEGWKHEKAIFASAIRDGISLWDGTTTSPTWGAVVPGVNDNPLEVPGAPGIDTMEAWGGPADYLVWTPSVGLMNWAGGLRSMGTRDIGQAAFLRPESYIYGPTGTEIPALPDREFTIAPTDATLK